MAWSSHRLDVLYEDNHLLVVNKPAMLPTMGVARGRASLLSLAKEYIRQKYNKPGNVYLGILSRLDAPVTGVVVIARTSKAAGRLSTAFRTRQVEKTYWAVVAGVPDVPERTLEHYLRKDERHRRVHTTHADCPDAQLARLHYQILSSCHDISLLEVQLETGRKHQIRVQLAKVGHPILGDRKYGSQQEFPQGIALHARSLQLQHPVRQESMRMKAPLPGAWREQRSVAQLL
ncbi:MAG: RluA family pseudouridine synthase [Pirellulales bacterium]|nr:RluA family pseudouridine synthase [Pirellulales bacterium]